MKKSIIGLALASTIFSTASFANEDLTNKMRTMLPGTPITNATYVPGIPGLVEVIVGKNRIIYASEDGSKVVIGHIYEPKTQTDLTQAKINELSKISWNELPFEHSFSIKKGDGSREFAVFTDVDCPFCARLENEMKNIDNYTMHVFLYPLKQSGRATTEAIWCSKDKGKAFHDYMTKRIKPANAGNCDTSPVEKSFQFAQQMGVSGTPTLIGKGTGAIKPGYMPAPQLNQWLEQNGK